MTNHIPRDKFYSLNDYRRDAKALILDRMTSTPAPASNSALPVTDEGEKILDPFYAAKWSAIARKRKCGLLLTILCFVAKRHHIDMTSILAQRLLEGWVGHSVSNKVLIDAFGDPNRTAANKSQDWQDVMRLVQLYKMDVNNALKRDKKKLKQIKQEVWEEISKQFA